MCTISVSKALGEANGPTPDKVDRRLAASDGLIARLTQEQRKAVPTTKGSRPEIAGIPGGARLGSNQSQTR
jgi:hypothetical protein